MYVMCVYVCVCSLGEARYWLWCERACCVPLHVTNSSKQINKCAATYYMAGWDLNLYKCAATYYMAGWDLNLYLLLFTYLSR